MAAIGDALPPDSRITTQPKQDQSPAQKGLLRPRRYTGILASIVGDK